MEKIFEAERKEQEEKERIEKELNPEISYFTSVKDSNFFFWFSVLFMIFSISCLGYSYFNIRNVGGGSSKFKGLN